MEVEFFYATTEPSFFWHNQVAAKQRLLDLLRDTDTRCWEMIET